MKTNVVWCLFYVGLSTTSVFAHGYMSGRLEDAILETDQVVLAKITAIKETPIYHILKDGRQGGFANHSTRLFFRSQPRPCRF